MGCNSGDNRVRTLPVITCLAAASSYSFDPSPASVHFNRYTLWYLAFDSVLLFRLVAKRCVVSELRRLVFPILYFWGLGMA